MADPQMKLPPGATLVQDDNQLPPGAVLDDAASNIPTTPGEAKRSLYAGLTAGYDPGAAEFDKAHPVLGKPVRFLSALGGTVMGLPGALGHAVFDPLTPEEEKDFQGHTRIPGEVTLERLTGARDIVEAGKTYADPKKRPTLGQAASILPEALGTGAGTVVGTELGARALGKGLSTVGKLREKMQPFARKVTGVEPAVKEAVTKASEKHAGALEDVEAQKQQQAERGAQAKTVDEQSMKVRDHIDKVEQSVAKEANAKFEKVREKIGNPETDATPLVETVKHVEANVLQNIPENIKEFRAIMRHEALPEDIAGAAQRHGFELEGPEPLTWDKLQSLKSRLDARLRSRSPMNGDLKRALYQTRDAVVDEMGKMADANGAQGEWSAARDFWRQYKEDFHESSAPGGSASPVARALNAVDPANIRQPFTGAAQSTLGNRGVDILRKYPQHGGTEAAAAVEGLVKGHKELKYMGPEKNPNPPAPKAPTVDVTKVAKDAIATRAKNWGNFNARDIGILASSVLVEPIVKLLGGNLGQGASNLLPVAAVAYEGGKYVASRALNSPKVVEWLAKTPAEEAAVIAKIPGADKVRVVEGLTQAALQSGKPVQLSPAARTLLGPANVAKIMAASGATQHTVKNRKDALDLLGQPPQ